MFGELPRLPDSAVAVGKNSAGRLHECSSEAACRRSESKHDNDGKLDINGGTNMAREQSEESYCYTWDHLNSP